MERLNAMSGILAFSFPCIIGASLSIPGGVKTELLTKQDSIAYFIQDIDKQMNVDSYKLDLDSTFTPQLSTDKQGKA
jgi:hypothetical protein